MEKILHAMFASCIVTIVICALIFMLPAYYKGDELLINSSGTMLIIYGFFVILGVMFIGLPIHLILAKFKITSVYIYLLIGSAFSLLINTTLNGSREVVLAVISIVLGAICALVFWLIAVKPNKALNSQPPAAGTPKDGAH